MKILFYEVDGMAKEKKCFQNETHIFHFKEKFMRYQKLWMEMSTTLHQNFY
jgi:hypothetical protein